MKISIKIFLLAVLLYSSGISQKNDIHFEHLMVEDGLSGNTILSIFQDSKGFLWIGTYNGLDRYNGYDFTHFKNSELDSTTISDNKVRAFCEDKNGDIWIGTWSGGLNKFIWETENFKRYLHNPRVPNSLSSNNITSMCKDNEDNLWIGTDGGGLNYFDVEKDTFIHYMHNPYDPNSISNNGINKVYLDNKGNLWCGVGSSGLCKYVKEENRFISFKHSDNDPKSICGNKVMAITEDKFGTLWIGTGDAGLNKFNYSTNQFYCYSHDARNPKSLSDVGIQVIFEDSEGLFWVGNTNSGLNLFDREKGTFKCFRKNYDDPRGLSDDGIYTIYEDHSGVLWFGTWNGGLNKYDRNKEQFINYSFNPNNSNSLSSDIVFSIYKDKSGILWIGTDGGGLNRINEDAQLFTHYKNNPADRTSISNDIIYSICEDLEGNIWVGTFGGGLNKFDKRTNSFQRFQNNPEDPKTVCGDDISQIFCDSYGDLWVGVFSTGLDRLKAGTKDFIHYINDPLNPRSAGSKIYAFYEDRSRNLWIGTYGNGLMMYNRKTDDFDFYRHDKDNPLNSLSSDIISSICEDSDGILWIGTNGKGFNRLDRIKKSCKTYTEKDGLTNDMVYGILKDNNDNLWISTGYGISRFNISSETFKNYYYKDGLQGNEFNQWAYFKSKEGNLYFGGTKGFTVFNPGEKRDNQTPPKVAITEFQLNHKPVNIGFDKRIGRTILEKSIQKSELVELKHDDNIISFEITALDFHNPSKNRYAYFLEGFDKNWTYTDASHRLITYTNLDPGEYTLKVNGSNNDGVWGSKFTSLKIIVHSPWWKTWWAYTIYILVIVSLFTGSSRFYLNRQRLRNQLALEHEHAKKLEELDELKSSFYANISHEFRTPLMLILGPVEKLFSRLADDDSKKQAGLIKGNATRLLKLINQLLDLSKIEAGKLKLRASPGNIAQFIKGLVMEFESIAEQKDISLKLLFEKEDIESYFDKEKLEKIITNLLSNSIKFTPKGGTITVSLKTIDHTLELIVKDTGIGIPKSKLPRVFDRFYQVDGSQTREYEGTGIGLALTKELVELHKGQIFLDSEEGEWTEVNIFLPLGKEHLSDEEIIEKYDTPEKQISITEDETITEKNEKEERLTENLVDKTIVLVVEDNPDVREYIKDALTELYHVEEAANGEQGLRKAEKYIPDLIISDIMMPKMDGYEMTKQIKKDEKTSHIPVILLTAKSDKASKMEGLGLGADDYLIKPFDTAELLIRIKNLIDTRKFLQDKFSRENFVSHKVEKPKFSQIDEVFMGRIMSVIEKNISDEEFSIEDIATEIGMGRTQIYRKIKGLTGKSPSVYLRSVRLSAAQEMIHRREATISEISYKVGFSSPAYFSRCFKEEFGYSPSEE